ncbi:MAG: DNA mismatch repair protein MutS [Clostridia bacterium]|nr:DNA mismatch repair protein MutS [Clostridia bacterium]
MHIKDIADRSKLSPMMTHYVETKEKIGDTILFYRLGDFYEMFFEDAETCAKVLDLTLTGKDCGIEERAPMCGIPHHASESYIAKMIEAGYKVAICEQLSDPSASKGLVQRGIVRIATPGTALEDEVLKADKNNFLCSVFADKNNIGICWADISTGLMEMCEYTGNEYIKYLDDTLSRIKPSEIICNYGALAIQKQLGCVRLGVVPDFYMYEETAFSFSKCEKTLKKQFGVHSLEVFDAEDKRYAIRSAGGLLAYLQETQKRFISNIKKLGVVKDDRYIHIDINTRRNLELVESMSLKRKRGSLLGLLDHTKTPMGARKMRLFIDQPLRDERLINERLDGVEELSNKLMLRDNLYELLNSMQDIERKCSKISAGTILPKECYTLAETLKNIPYLKNILSQTESKILRDANNKIIDLTELADMLISAINPESSSSLKDGGYIAKGFSTELDQARTMGEYGKQWLAELEQNEKEKTGIKNLKTGYNKIFGYYIEVTNSWLSQVPENYIRKQTTTTGERYITPELKEMEYKILTSVDEALKIESKLYQQIKDTLASYINEMLETADAIAIIDCLLSFSLVSLKYHYTKPVISSSISHIKIVDGRHPVVESLLDGGTFAPNDTLLDQDENRTMLITGPNMAGKSTYMRQVAIITLMAHIGCFVPAREAEISVVDRIFTRVGASDDLAFGQSTFMVEMTEVANILNNATDKSLIILDEVGRGTSTYDGLSIAWAIMEYLSKHLKAKTLFATHYHELTELEGDIDGVKNYRVMVKELNDSIIFLHKIARGSANKSFGIEVAKLAGLPDELVVRAKEVLKVQEDANRQAAIESGNFVDVESYCPNGVEVINILRDMDMNTISPIMAFGTLQNLVDKVKK